MCTVWRTTPPGRGSVHGNPAWLLGHVFDERDLTADQPVALFPSLPPCAQPQLNPWSKSKSRELPFYGPNELLPVLLACVMGFQHSLSMVRFRPAPTLINVDTPIHTPAPRDQADPAPDPNSPGQSFKRVTRVAVRPPLPPHPPGRRHYHATGACRLVGHLRGQNLPAGSRQLRAHHERIVQHPAGG